VLFLFVHSEVSRNPQIVREILKFAAEKSKGGRNQEDESDDEMEPAEDTAGECRCVRY
jgi:hypothetical protein